VLSDGALLVSALDEAVPSASREVTMLGTAARAGLASQLTGRVDRGTPVAEAIDGATKWLATATLYDGDACRWMAEEFAGALGLESPPEPDSFEGVLAPFVGPISATAAAGTAVAAADKATAAVPAEAVAASPAAAVAASPAESAAAVEAPAAAPVEPVAPPADPSAADTVAPEPVVAAAAAVAPAATSDDEEATTTPPPPLVAATGPTARPPGGRRWAGLVVALLLVGGYLVAASIAHITPFRTSSNGTTTSLPTTSKPVIMRVIPSGGPATGGNIVTVQGSSLGGAVVTLAGHSVGASCSPSSCTFTAPPGQQAELLSVRTPQGQTQALYQYSPVRRGALMVGISYGDSLPFMTPAQLAVSLNDAVAVGANWIQVDLSWFDIQPSAGVFTWSGFDRLVAAANARHLSILPVVDYTATFAEPAGCASEMCAPTDPTGFAAFAAAAARRYAPLGIHTWEIWNEPNSGRFWLPKPDPSAYVSLLRLTADSIRSVEPHATILTGGLGTHELGSTGIAPLAFLSSICALGANKIVDGVAFQPYPAPLLPSSTSPSNAWNLITGGPQSIEGIVGRAGTPGLPVWISQTGAPTDGPGPAASSPPGPNSTTLPTHLTENYQARFVTDTIATAEANPAVVDVNWFTDQDAGGTLVPDNYYGLRRLNGSLKPSYFALAKAIGALPK
jgi:hypothetical protein